MVETTSPTVRAEADRGVLRGQTQSTFAAAVNSLEQRWGILGVGLIIAIVAELTSVFFAATCCTDFAERFTNLCPNPFTSAPVVLPEHRLRILGPVIAYCLGLRGLPATMIPIVANIPLLVIVYWMLRRRGVAAATAALTLFTLSTTHVTMSSRVLLGYQDSLVFLFIVIAMAVDNPWFGGIALFLGMFGDQRAVLAVPLVLVWHAIDDERPDAWKRFFTRSFIYGIFVVVWIAASAAVLHYISQGQAVQSSIRGILLGNHLEKVKPGYLQLSYFMAFKAAWLFPVVICLIWLRRRPWLVLVMVGSLALILIGAILVDDLSRAASFAFPMILIAIVGIWRRDPILCTHLILACLIINLITPFYQGMNSGLWLISYPLPVELARAVWRVMHPG
jgi:hypothetical protein